MSTRRGVRNVSWERFRWPAEELWRNPVLRSRIDRCLETRGSVNNEQFIGGGGTRGESRRNGDDDCPNGEACADHG